MVKRFTFLVCFVGLFVWPILVRTAAPSQQASQVTPTSVPQDRSAVGYLDLHKRHPNAAEGVEEFNTGYSVDEALRSLAQMRTFLVSFRELTELAQGKLSPAELAKAGSTSAETQTIGFRNVPLTVEGSLLKQEYELRQVQYELAQLKRARGQNSVADVNRARAAYADATKRFQAFWDTSLPTDYVTPTIATWHTRVTAM